MPLGSANVDGPFPSGLIAGAADGHPTDVHKLELALLERADLVWMLETFENDFVHNIFRDVIPNRFTGEESAVRVGQADSSLSSKLDASE
jgi:hypothetical protein